MSVVITIKNDLRCYLDGDFDDKGLDALFSFYTSKFWWRSPAARFGRWDGKIHLYDRISGMLPLGLLSMTKRWLDKQGVEYKITDYRASSIIKRRKVVKTLGGNITLRNDQRTAILKAVTKERGIIHGATGSGKSEIAVGIIATLGNPKTLFLTGRKKLARQTRERFAVRLGCPVDDIGFIQGGKWIHGKSGIYVAVVDTYMQKKFTIERNKLNADAKLLFIDECHHSPGKMWYRTIMQCGARYRFGLTGTPVGRSDGADLKLRACTGSIIARIRAVDLVSQGILAKPTIYYTEISRPKLFATGEVWSVLYRQAIVNNKLRNDIIARYAKELAKLGKLTLILVRELAHGYKLKQAVSKSVFVHGGTADNVLDETVKRFERGEVKTLIATGIFDEGVDIPCIDALILAAGGKSQIATLQRIGRGMRRKEGRNDVAVFDFIDRMESHFLEHSLRRMTICKSEGYQVQTLKKDGHPLSSVLP